MEIRIDTNRDIGVFNFLLKVHSFETIIKVFIFLICGILTKKADTFNLICNVSFLANCI